MRYSCLLVLALLMSCGGGGNSPAVDVAADLAVADIAGPGADVGRVDGAADGGVDGRGADSLGDVEVVQLPECNPSAWGPHAVGYWEMQFVDTERDDRPLPARVFFPAEGPAEFDDCFEAFVALDPFSRQVRASICSSQGLSPWSDSGPLPVVFVSHGDGGQKEGHTFEAEYLASHGFVVVTFDHTGNCGFAQTGPEDLNMSVTRLLDLVFVMDSVLGDALIDTPLAGLADASRVALAGHSWGGHTVALASGLEYNWQLISDNCEAGQPYDDWYCAPLQDRELVESLTPDPRVKAVVTWAHDAGHIVSAPKCVGAPSVKVPWMQIIGTEDKYADEIDDGQECYSKTGAYACLVTMDGAGHMGYSGFGDDGTLGAELVFDVVRSQTADFLIRTLGSDGTCRPRSQALPGPAGVTSVCRSF